jgi:hypothetical protein
LLVTSISTRHRSVSAVDALLACAGDHCTNLKAEDLSTRNRHVAPTQVKMASVETRQGRSSPRTSEVETDVVDKFAAFDEAFEALEPKKATRKGMRCPNRPTTSTCNDGLYGSSIALSIEVCVDPSDEACVRSGCREDRKGTAPRRRSRSLQRRHRRRRARPPKSFSRPLRSSPHPRRKQSTTAKAENREASR